MRGIKGVGDDGGIGMARRYIVERPGKEMCSSPRREGMRGRDDRYQKREMDTA